MIALLAIVFVIVLNIWHRRWLKSHKAEEKKQLQDEITADAQHWQL